MADENPDVPKPTVTPAELQAGFAGPAVYANKVLLTMTPVTARLSFIEVHPESQTAGFRAAVSMTITDLVALQTLLNRTLTPNVLGSFKVEADGAKG